MTQEITSTGRAPATVTRTTKETLEDYTLRFAPRHYRKWSTGVVAVSALGGIAYLADFAIGANIGIAYGTTNALWGILVFTVVIFATGFPLAFYAARYNLDLDLITWGSGFGYYGSVVTNVIFATFTFIFFALEGSIMARGLQLGLGIPLWLGYPASTIIIFPLVVYGMSLLSKLRLWTTPLWLALMVAPFGYLLISHPESVGQFFAYQADRADRRADRLPALHAAPHPGELAALVDRHDPGRSGLGDLRRAQADRRAVPGRLPDRQRGADRGRGQPARLPVPGDLHRHHAGLVGADPGRGAGRDQPDQDQSSRRSSRSSAGACCTRSTRSASVR
jgi:hypothetical protein